MTSKSAIVQQEILNGNYTIYTLVHCMTLLREVAPNIMFLHLSDYGYKRALGTTGPCIRDTDLVIPDPCANDDGATYDKTTGYVITFRNKCVRCYMYPASFFILHVSFPLPPAIGGFLVMCVRMGMNPSSSPTLLPVWQVVPNVAALTMKKKVPPLYWPFSLCWR